MTEMTDKIVIEVDYKGNIYLKYKDTCYNILFDIDSDCGIQLDTTDVKILRSTFEDNKHISKYVKQGNIMLSDCTLKGRITHILNNTDPNELDELHYTSYDTSFKESEYFLIQSVQMADDTDEEIEIDDEYVFSGVEKDIVPNADTDIIHKSIIFSDLLNDMSAHYSTILIKGNAQSKIVTSVVQRHDEYCTKRLIMYTDGTIKVQYIDHKIMYCKIDILDDKLKLCCL